MNNNGVPPIDAFGFARSHVYSYNYFNPNAQYLPWSRGDGSTYPNSSATAARMAPHNNTTYNLTVNLLSQNANAQFQAHLGMRLPSGMRFRLTGNTNANCGGLSNGGTNNVREIGASGHTMTATCGMYIEYFPATFYLPIDHPLPEGFIEANRTTAANACSFTAATGVNRCDMYRYEIKPENYVGGAGGAAYQAAIRNFANWFTYYGTRQNAAIASASHALADVNNMRVGYFTINARNNVTMYDMGVASQKAALFGIGNSASGTIPATAPGASTLLGLPANGGSTPNTSAVNFLGQQFQRVPGSGERIEDMPIQVACQKNAGMLFTDGFNNDSATPTAPAINGLGAPFDTTGANTMAAIASRYYYNHNTNTVGLPGTSPLRGTTGAGAFAGGRCRYRKRAARSRKQVPNGNGWTVRPTCT
ncbi:MAG: hypothetical protein NVV60_05835 [Luteimonas sp.]|nr:hypothetical protein [Luteimonas sp.]